MSPGTASRKYLCVRAERHGRVDQTAIGKTACLHNPVEIIRGPRADAGFGVGRDVGRINRTKGCCHRQATGEQSDAGIRVAGDAIAGARQVFALGHEIMVVGLRRGGRAAKDRQ
jgi:hypothetical protein